MNTADIAAAIKDAETWLEALVKDASPGSEESAHLVVTTISSLKAARAELMTGVGKDGKVVNSFLPLPAYLAEDEVLASLIAVARTCRPSAGDTVTAEFIEAAEQELEDRGSPLSTTIQQERSAHDNA